MHQLDIVEYEYPRLVLDIRCGSGTYVRSLGRDLAESLGTAAVMSELVRTAVGPFCVEEACVLRELNRDSLARRLLPAPARHRSRASRRPALGSPGRSLEQRFERERGSRRTSRT